MKRDIYSITEAYSIQPECYYIGREYINGKKKYKVAKIVWELVNYSSHSATYGCYVGYDDTGLKIFEYLETSVNVNYCDLY